ncbi:replication protein A 70 kDa DNA-binding subunit B-like [Ziziphus jujuba]|uniref:Replication protein A 70 kDa DNA-binding subunit B-like n=1 Tax=Ziziphus jujuba TaxID=326968 RepID=A0ABM4ADR2_ZIZJJ|nr:replication protein A 70 kDa DNA-binding subunit B-like [Ziziphus jujuba]
MVREVKLIKDIQAQQRLDNVIGIAIEIKPKKEIITNDGLEIVQEMTLMNDNMDAVMLTMWNQFVTNECISLSTKSSSSFVIEPEIPQAATLSIWYNANAEKAMDIICERIGLETKSLSTLPSAEDIVTIKMIDNQLNTRRSFWINGHIKVTNLIQPFWYLTCEKCTKATGYEFEQRFNCLYCRHDQVKAMPRCRVIVDLIDESSSLNATLFGNQAENFLDTSNDAEVSQVLEIVEEQSGKSLGIIELRDISGSVDNAKIEQMSNEDKVLADLVSKPTARNNATKKLKLMISKSADEADPIALNVESSHLEFGEGGRKQFAELKDNA